MPRIGRIYTSLCAIDLGDLNPRVGAEGNVFASINVSDHLSILCYLSMAGAVVGVVTIPRWMLTDYTFQSVFEPLSDSSISNVDVWKDLEVLKTTLRETANYIMKHTKRLPAATLQKTYWATRAWRAARDHKLAKLSQAVGVLPELDGLFCLLTGRCLKTNNFSDLFHTWTTGDVDEQIRELDAIPRIDGISHDGKKRCLLHWSAQFVPTKGKVGGLLIKDELGEVFSTDVEGAVALKDYWEDFFKLRRLTPVSTISSLANSRSFRPVPSGFFPRRPSVFCLRVVALRPLVLTASPTWLTKQQALSP